MNSSIYTKEIRNYIDYKYIPTLLHKECTIKDMNTTIKDYVQCLEKIKNYKHKNTIIVSHGGMNYIIFFRWLNSFKKLDVNETRYDMNFDDLWDKSTGEKKTNFVSIFEKKKLGWSTKYDTCLFYK